MKIKEHPPTPIIDRQRTTPKTGSKKADFARSLSEASARTEQPSDSGASTPATAGSMDLTSVRELMAAGLDRHTPGLVVQDGTTSRQRRVFGELHNLPERVAAAQLHAPSIIIIGKTVTLAEELDWYQPSFEDTAHAPDTNLTG